MKIKVGEWIHRIVCLVIFENLISMISFVVIYVSLSVLTETNNFNFWVSIGLLNTTLALVYLRIANMAYWLMGINLFNFKKLWRKK
ncbi:hypothetical protein DRN69_07845 [Candidatus Pacearchaeota archaeon]|nr:MAG: hypothetical protein DRN69_07845 [Candidatus Pacearchaeota archaeon]